MGYQPKNQRPSTRRKVAAETREAAMDAFKAQRLRGRWFIVPDSTYFAGVGVWNTHKTGLMSLR